MGTSEIRNRPAFGTLIEYDFDASGTLAIPGDWNTQEERLFLYEGTIWHKKSFTYELEPGHRLFLYFGAANYEAIVYLNGKRIGRHEGGFTPFNFEITEFLREGPNDVILKVDNKRLREGVPTLNTDWWNYGGLTRSVHLVDVPATFVTSYAVGLSEDNGNAEDHDASGGDGRRVEDRRLDSTGRARSRTVCHDSTSGDASGGTCGD